MGFNARKTLVFLGSFFDSADLPLWRPYNLSWWHSWFMLWRPHQYSLFSMPWRCKCEENLKLTNNYWFFAHFFFPPKKSPKAKSVIVGFPSMIFLGLKLYPHCIYGTSGLVLGVFPSFACLFRQVLNLAPNTNLLWAAMFLGHPY